jgi:phage replication-related protein YjqB (UPF0714/DUF867 family)
MTAYRSYHELKEVEREGRDYRVDFRKKSSSLAILAPHGGDIEPGTSEIADALAGDSHSFYSFEGIKRHKNNHLHISSSLFDEPTGLDVASNAETVITVHGCKGEDNVVYVGGRDMGLKERVIRELDSADFFVRESRRYPGMRKSNLCNRGRSGKGVQVEISFGLRKRMFKSLYRKGRQEPTRIFERFVMALKRVF